MHERTWTISLELTPPGRLERLWYRRLGSEPPGLTASTGPRSEKLARLLPYSWRWWHRRYAAAHGFFWMPCVLCGREFGGHEGGDAVPNPMAEDERGIVVCSACTRVRNEQRAVLDAR